VKRVGLSATATRPARHSCVYLRAVLSPSHLAYCTMNPRYATRTVSRASAKGARRSSPGPVVLQAVLQAVRGARGVQAGVAGGRKRGAAAALVQALPQASRSPRAKARAKRRSEHVRCRCVGVDEDCEATWGCRASPGVELAAPPVLKDV
jgi:hypothetical protein